MLTNSMFPFTISLLFIMHVFHFTSIDTINSIVQCYYFLFKLSVVIFTNKEEKQDILFFTIMFAIFNIFQSSKQYHFISARHILVFLFSTVFSFQLLCIRRYRIQNFIFATFFFFSHFSTFKMSFHHLLDLVVFNKQLNILHIVFPIYVMSFIYDFLIFFLGL